MGETAESRRLPWAKLLRVAGWGGGSGPPDHCPTALLRLKARHYATKVERCVNCHLFPWALGRHRHRQQGTGHCHRVTARQRHREWRRRVDLLGLGRRWHVLVEELPDALHAARHAIQEGTGSQLLVENVVPDAHQSLVGVERQLREHRLREHVMRHPFP